MWTEQEYMDMFFEEDANEDMIYTVGEEVRYTRTGQFGIITAVDGFNRVYTVDIDGTEYSVSENELN